MWTWLGKASNQRTLAFLGGGIAALVALLGQMGVFKGEETSAVAVIKPKPTPATPASPTSPPSTALEPDQSVKAGDGASVVQNHGNNNQISIGK